MNAPSRRIRLDRLGIVVAAIGLGGLLLPFALFRANRIVSGTGESIASALSPGLAALVLILLGAAIASSVFRIPPRIRFAIAAAALLLLGIAIGFVPDHLVPPDNRFARVGPGSGFWLLLFAFSILAADAVAKLAPSPLARIAVLAGAIAILAIILVSGHWDGLSIMREYAGRSDSFWQEAAQHVRLALGSLVAAVIVGLPLGIACARLPALRAVALPILNIIQTIPSMAMYGLMMVPLGILAANVPLAAAIGIRGIGAAPAYLALFLYSLLPVAANTLVGLSEVPRAVLDAADGMGMTPRQRLFRIELPLALPVILTGIRIVLVQNVGLVTIAALIGGGGFGTFVFQGIGQAATDLVLLGAIPTIALAFAGAMLLDAVIDGVRGARA